MIKKTADLAENLIFGFVLDAKCHGCFEVDQALGILKSKIAAAKLKILKSQQLDLLSNETGKDQK